MTRPTDQSSREQDQYRKKPVVITASQWFKNGDHPEDNTRLITPVPGDGAPFLSEGKVVRYYRRPDVPGSSACEVCGAPHHDHGWVDTLEQGHRVCPGDWIITGIKGERYPCKPDIFAATYEPATPTAITAEEAGREGEAHVPYLCIAPVCGPQCDGCNAAISPQQQRDYARRYALLRNHNSARLCIFEVDDYGNTKRERILVGGHADEAIDAAMLPPAPAQSGGQG